jgi:hypothetical protein
MSARAPRRQRGRRPQTGTFPCSLPDHTFDLLPDMAAEGPRVWPHRTKGPHRGAGREDRGREAGRTPDSAAYRDSGRGRLTTAGRELIRSRISRRLRSSALSRARACAHCAGSRRPTRAVPARARPPLDTGRPPRPGREVFRLRSSCASPFRASLVSAWPVRLFSNARPGLRFAGRGRDGELPEKEDDGVPTVYARTRPRPRAPLRGSGRGHRRGRDRRAVRVEVLGHRDETFAGGHHYALVRR